MKLESLEDLKVGDKLIALTYDFCTFGTLNSQIYEITSVNKDTYTIFPSLDFNNKISKEVYKSYQNSCSDFVKIFGEEQADFLRMKFCKDSYNEFIRYTNEIHKKAVELETLKKQEKLVEEKTKQNTQGYKTSSGFSNQNRFVDREEGYQFVSKNQKIIKLLLLRNKNA